MESAVPADDLPVRGQVVLRLLSPLSLRRGSDQTGSLTAMVSSLGNRISGLALWHDLRLEADWRALRDLPRFPVVTPRAPLTRLYRHGRMEDESIICRSSSPP